jgi:hypothetical protein
MFVAQKIPQLTIQLVRVTFVTSFRPLTMAISIDPAYSGVPFESSFTQRNSEECDRRVKILPISVSCWTAWQVRLPLRGGSKAISIGGYHHR